MERSWRTRIRWWGPTAIPPWLIALGCWVGALVVLKRRRPCLVSRYRCSFRMSLGFGSPASWPMALPPLILSSELWKCFVHLVWWVNLSSFLAMAWTIYRSPTAPRSPIWHLSMGPLAEFFRSTKKRSIICASPGVTVTRLSLSSPMQKPKACGAIKRTNPCLPRRLSWTWEQSNRR